MKNYNNIDTAQDGNRASKMRNICIMLGVVLVGVIVLSSLLLKPDTGAVSDSSTNADVENITISEILNGRANGYGTTQIYKLSAGLGEGLMLGNLGKDTKVEIWNYNGQSIDKVYSEIPLGSIADGSFKATLSISDGYDNVNFNIITDPSGNNTICEQLCDENGKSLFTFGGSALSYCTTITVYNKTYICFIEEVFGDYDFVKGDIIFIEDREDTQNKNISFDTVGTQGVTVDGK